MTDNNHFPKILIVDDVAVNIDLLKSILQQQNYLIASAKNGQTALAKARANVFDIILLDIVLPDIDGFEVCRQLKSNSLNLDTPVIFMTGQRDEESLVKGFSLGAVDYVQKPFSAEELKARVELHLSLKKTQQELKKAKEIAEEAAKAKSLFLANMSHEIRTPLNGVMGMVDILRQTELDAQQQEYLEIIDISSETLLMIINDILDFSKIEAGQITFERIKFNFRNEIEDVHKLLTYRAKQKGLAFHVSVDDDVPKMLIGDPLRLKQILINLINNAIKFTEEGHVNVKIKLERDLGQKFKLRFEVEDTGIGISRENQDKLFKSFSQADTSTTRKFGGTGLGLAISKRLTNLMNGEIGVESEDGNGSVFWFTAVFDEAPAVSDINDFEEIDLRDHPSSELNILLVEDNVINQKVSMLNIRKLGHNVELAHNGVVAVEMFAKNSFDLILMDIQMPVMDGLEATRAIRHIETERGTNNGIPIVAMTANNCKEDIKHYLENGMTDHLGKPFRPTDLELVIDRNVKRKIIN